MYPTTNSTMNIDFPLTAQPPHQPTTIGTCIINLPYLNPRATEAETGPPLQASAVNVNPSHAQSGLCFLSRLQSSLTTLPYSVPLLRVYDYESLSNTTASHSSLTMDPFPNASILSSEYLQSAFTQPKSPLAFAFTHMRMRLLIQSHL
ncbi:hypothetical protein CNYM01_06216 [Colletotrichum nymphaeae SA-01]|uniref:Uncharacterized protein n=1 Tax=Colletotrichum nymphaeae SA-01 TaxID=1460502 RepID=A0A135SVS4_9PEZI|nr:hypothetical protein CNYM01_06216 [Colletotrichum nymphaeae SA-01]